MNVAGEKRHHCAEHISESTTAAGILSKLMVRSLKKNLLGFTIYIMK